MDLWVSFWSALTESIAENGLPVVALIVLLRSAAVPIPVPADLLVVIVGAQAREQHALLWPAWLVLAMATTVGAALFYAFVRWIGQGDVSHYGRYIGLTTERLTAAEMQLTEGGVRAVFLARVVPGLRLAIVAVCGMVSFDWWKFVAGVALGALIYVGACLTIGYVFGDAINELIGDLVFPFGLVEPVAGLSILLFWLVRARRTTPRLAAGGRLSRASRVRVGALAGALAIAGATMLLNIIIYFVAPIAADAFGGIRGPQTTLTFSAGLGSILQLILDSAVVGVLWGVVYALEDGRSAAGWRDWWRGLAFALLPFLVVMVAQLLVVLQSERSLSAWLILGIGEAVRWGTYGVLIGLTYPVLRARRLQPLANGPSTNQTNVIVESRKYQPGA
jgi:membrane protein DedA with SNARE-associated domain